VQNGAADLRWRRKILRLICGGFAVETQNVASLRVNPHQNRLGASP
jgi:hypothetical protein